MSKTKNTVKTGRLSIASLLSCVAATVVATAQAASIPEFKPVEIEVNITGLPASEQAALVPILRAARQMDELYMQQVWPGTRALIIERRVAKTPLAQAELNALNDFKGPWDQNGAPLFAGIPAKRPIGDFYPANATKQDIDTWLGTVPDSEREQALNPFTAIERDQDGRFSVLPYNVRYKEGLMDAATALREAAALTHEETLKNFLTLRAQALLDDKYYASDVAFVGLKGPIDVVLGPYEVDDDGWFGVKTTYEASIALVNGPATQRIEKISSRMQDLENHLPLSPELRGRQLPAAAPIFVLDAIYHGGYTAAMFAVSYGLPNDLKVLNEAGARTGTYSNIIKVRYDRTYKPIADAVLTDRDKSTLRFEDIRDEMMFVHIFDSLGPQLVTGTQQPISEALREDGYAASMTRAMLLSLWGHRYLVQHGYLDRREGGTVYSAFLVPALARARTGVQSCTPCQGSTYILNHLLEARAISLGADGRVRINAAAADAEVARAAKEFISPMAKGDATTVKSLLQRYAVVTPAISDIVARLSPPPPGLLRPIYSTADRLSH